jgi:hypothetical protein
LRLCSITVWVNAKPVLQHRRIARIEHRRPLLTSMQHRIADTEASGVVAWHMALNGSMAVLHRQQRCLSCKFFGKTFNPGFAIGTT